MVWGLGFEFLIDTTTKYNWIDPELINFFSISSETTPLDKSFNRSIWIAFKSI